MESTQEDITKTVESTAVAGEALSVKSKEKLGNISVMNDDNDAPPQIEDSNETAKSSTIQPETEASTDSKQQDSSTLERASWDYTNRRVVVRNVLKHMNNKDVVKMTSSWLATLPDPKSIVITKTRKAPNQPWIQVTLEHVDMVQPFIQHLNTSKFQNRRGQVLNAQRVEPDKDNRKRQAQDNDERDAKRLKEPECKTDDQVRDAITPYWRMPYEQQLNTKQREMIKKCAVKITQEVKKRFRNLQQEAKRNKNRDTVPLYDWIAAKQPIHMEEILPSPTQTQYRNKCEMNFGYQHEVDTSGETVKMIPAVGFMASGWSGGVSRPHMLANIPSEACAIVDVVNEFLKDSPTAPYDSKAHRGLWRVLTIRTSRRTQECMVIIMHAPPSGGLGSKDETDDYSQVFESEKARLVSMLTDREIVVPERDYKVSKKGEKGEILETDDDTRGSSESPTRIKVTSIFFQEFEGVSNPPPKHPVQVSSPWHLVRLASKCGLTVMPVSSFLLLQHAYGKTSIQEKLGKCTFQISPGAFFQVNTEGSETLYDQVLAKVKEVSPNPKDTLLLDVCCGTGTIGQYCMKEGAVGRVVGVDISEPAIADAKINAEINGFASSDDSQPSDRTRFIAARAEDVLAKELKKESTTTNVIAVVDPARDGLHSDVLKTLRMKEKIQRVVYVSCNPIGSLVRDSGLLCAPPTKRYPGRPYYPSSAQPVDMFPLTPHCEMVMTFDRLPEQSDKKRI